MQLVVDSGADLVLNALVGSAGLGPDRRDAGRGHRPRAGQQGVAGRRRRARHAAGRGDGRADASRSTPSTRRCTSCSPARRPGRVERLVAHRLGRPVPRPHARRAGGRHRRGGARAPDLGDGRQDHDRLGDADEQGPGGDRGAPPVRHAVRPHRRRRAPAVDRPRADAAVRRRHARAPRLPGHARRRSPTRCTTPSASTCRSRRSTWPRSGALTFEAVDDETFACLRLAREAARRRRHRAVRPQRRQRGGGARLPGRPPGLPRHRRGDRGRRWSACPPSPSTPSSRSTRPTARRARVAGELVAARAARMSWLLAFARLRRADHPPRGRATSPRPRRSGCAWSASRCSSRRCSSRSAAARPSTAIGAIPLGGYVRITGMNPDEEIPPEVAHRAYFRQPVWKRIVVIAAGPAMNILVAFLILWGAVPRPTAPARVTDASAASSRPARRRDPAARRPRDRRGRRARGDLDRARPARSRATTAPGRPVNGCRATTPARVTVERDGAAAELHDRPPLRRRRQRHAGGLRLPRRRAATRGPCAPRA